MSTALTSRASRLLDLTSPTEREVENLLATTLVLAVVTPSADGVVAQLVRAGDSGAWLLRGGGYTAVFDVQAPDAALLSSAVSPLPRLPSPVVPVTRALSPDTVLLVGTDGFGNPLGDGTGLVGDLFAEALHTPPPALGFAHALDFSRETFDDDRTLVALWPFDAR